MVTLVEGERAPDGVAAEPVATPPALRACAAYGGEPESIAAARWFTADFLARGQADHGVPVSSHTVGVARLVVSELVTNACKYAPGPCSVDLELAGAELRITVWDTSPVLPIARAAEPGRVGQHGLELVLAQCEGFDVRREPIGKRIRVRIAVEP
ncbi:ATP-binding protein [Streptomyces taklimakanensis]|uniref:ATP-binding protein n=1 Tax=Streptomyces taklimakanensis TaxID=2569853 RepID=UPI001EE4A8A6|nr:ATP-binding protein [Streptomyces taklimakanensis]